MKHIAVLYAVWTKQQAPVCLTSLLAHVTVVAIIILFHSSGCNMILPLLLFCEDASKQVVTNCIT